MRRNIPSFSSSGGKLWKSDPVIVEIFAREFLRREPSPKQLEALIAVCGDKADKFDSTYDELVLMVGQKGGKNYTVEILVAYYLYKLANLVNPHLFFNVDKGIEFNIANSSLVNEAQARNVFFERIKNVITRTIDPVSGDNWFEKYAGLDLRPGGFGDMKAKTIEIPTIPGYGKIKMHSFDSTPEAPEGLTIFLGIMDEPSRANTPNKYESAKKLYRMYMGNVKGSFPGGVGKVLMFSYPEQETNDLTVERFNQGLTEPKTFVMKASTFEFNPNTRKEDYQKAYDADPVDAKCRFECIIPASRFGFFQPYVSKITECIDEKIVNTINFKPAQIRRKVDDKELAFTGVELISVKGDNKLRVWAGDAGIVKDAFVLTGGYAEYIRDDGSQYNNELEIYRYDSNTGQEIKEKIVLNGKVVIDTIVVWRPERGMPIDYVDVENVFLNKILPKFPNTQSVHFDKFNSESFKAKITAMGILCETHNFSNMQQYRIYRILRHLIWNNQFSFPAAGQYCFSDKDAPAEKELRELLLINKNRIDHPSGGSKDVADTFALLAAHVLQVENRPGMRVLSMNMKHDFDEAIRLYQYWQIELRKQLNREPSIDDLAQAINEAPEIIIELQDYIESMADYSIGLNGVLPEGSNYLTD